MGFWSDKGKQDAKDGKPSDNPCPTGFHTLIDLITPDSGALAKAGKEYDKGYKSNKK